VAAVNLAADRHAEVKWNDKINGRQFDVSIRYKKGLYDFLIVIECKDYSSPVSVDKVEAFVTKSRSVSANRAIIASFSGFQSGAIECAAQNGILLYNIATSKALNLPPGVSEVGRTPSNVVTDIKFHFVNGELWPVPGYVNEVAYYLNKARIEGRPCDQFLNELLTPLLIGKTFDQEKKFEVPLPDRMRLRGENEDEIPEGDVVGVSFAMKTEEAIELHRKIKYDTSMLLPHLYAEDVIGDKRTVFDLIRLPYRLDEPLQTGAFYEHPITQKRYYLEEVRNGLLKLFLVESFQHGMLIQAEFTQEIRYFDYAEKVTDVETIARLERRLARMTRS